MDDGGHLPGTRAAESNNALELALPVNQSKSTTMKMHGEKEVTPEQIIPLEETDDDFKDF